VSLFYLKGSFNRFTCIQGQ